MSEDTPTIVHWSFWVIGGVTLLYNLAEAEMNRMGFDAVNWCVAHGRCFLF